MEENSEESQEAEGLCRECGHALKVYIDRVTHRGGAAPAEGRKAECPVCGCGDCRIGR
jgi:hypothetical protein